MMRRYQILLLAALLAIAAASRAGAAEDLAEANGCTGCHAVDRALVGPSLTDIAARYRGKPEARAALVETVRNGGKGHWTSVTGGVPMPPYSGRLSQADTEQLVDWVLGH